MEHISDLFGNLNKELKIKSERASIIFDISNIVNSLRGNRKKLSERAIAVFLSPLKTQDLHVLLSKMNGSKNPGAVFWWHVKPKNDI